MELKDFIRKTIIEVAEGINDAHAQMQDDIIGYATDQAIDINFDVSISFDDASAVAGGGKLNVAGIISGGANKEVKTTNSQNNKVQLKMQVYVVTGRRKSKSDQL